MRTDVGLPAIVVDGFSVERVTRPHRVTPSDRATWHVHPPGTELVHRLRVAANATRQRYERTVGTHRDFRPRLQSRVEHRIAGRADDTLDALRGLGELHLCVGPVRLTGDPSAAHYDAVEHEYRLPCRLHLAWSWPELPMWLAVGEVSTTSGALTLSLRSRRRLRYPMRYFHAAHAVLSGLESRLL